MLRRRETATRFGELLREHRLAGALTLESLGGLAGLSASHLSKLESGEREPTEHSLMVLCRALTLATPERDALYLAARLIPPGVSLDTLARLLGRVRAGDLRLLLEDEALLTAALDLARAARGLAHEGTDATRAA